VAFRIRMIQFTGIWNNVNNKPSEGLHERRYNQMLENLEWKFHKSKQTYIRRDIYVLLKIIHTFKRGYEN
jgi:hypothetical protein